jgi:hypothetical protein
MLARSNGGAPIVFFNLQPSSGQRMVDGALTDVAKELFVSWLPHVSIHAPFNRSRHCRQLETSDQKLKLRRISHKDDNKLLDHFQNRYGGWQ